MKERSRKLVIESLESREMLSVSPLMYAPPKADWFVQLDTPQLAEPLAVGAAQTSGIVENEWLIQLTQESLKAISSVSKAADYLDDYGVTVIGGLGSPGTLHVKIDNKTSELQSEILAGISGLDYWESNYAFASAGVADNVNDLYANEQWALDAINILPAWNKTTGEGVVVAVIDTGIQLNHPDLQANIWTNPGEIAGNEIDDDGNGFIDDIHGWNTYSNNSDVSDTYGHGTMMSGLIGAVGNNRIGVIGVAPDVKILPIKAGESGLISTTAVVAGINYLIKLKTQYGVNIRVINASFAGPGINTAERTAIIAAGNAGIMFIAGAGNKWTDTDLKPFSPACNNDLDNVISVGGTDQNDLLSSVSNYGVNSVDLAAPVFSLTTALISAYAGGTGTSNSTAIVTGAVALLTAAHPDWTPAQIKEAILASVDPIPSLDGKVKTGGRLNVGDAINWSFDSVAQKPNAPSHLTAFLQTDGSFQLKWNDNSKNETSFELQYSHNNGAWTSINNINLGRNKTTATFVLSISGTYKFQIRAVNAGGASDWSTSASIVKDTSSPPSTPTGLTLSMQGSGIACSWNNIPGADNYRLERTPDGQNDWEEVYFGTNASYYDSDVIPSIWYSYRVYTVSSGIVSNPSTIQSQSAPPQFPDIPTGITISALGANSVQLIWSDVKYAQHYIIERFDPKKKQWIEMAQTTVASYAGTSLQPVTSYSYRILAENVLKSEYSETVTLTTLALPPKAPGSVKAVAQGNSVELTWKAAAGATGYRVEYSLTGQADSWEMIFLSPSTSTGGTAMGLTSSTKYYFRVYAVSNSGESEKPSSTISVTTPPEEPENVIIRQITDKTVTLAWDAVANATSYKVEKFVNGKWSSAGTSKTPEITIKSLKPLTDYTFRVIALNKTVASVASNVIPVTTPFAMTTTIAKSGYALTSSSDFAFMFSGKTPVGNDKTGTVSGNFVYELIVSSGTKTDPSGKLLNNVLLGTISVTLSADQKTYTTQPVNFNLLTAAVPNLASLKNVQFQLKVTCPTSPSPSQASSEFYTKVAKLTLPKWFV